MISKERRQGASRVQFEKPLDVRIMAIDGTWFNFGNTWTTATPPAISSPSQGEGPQMSEVFDDIIDRETDVAPHRGRRRIGFQVCIFRHCRVRGAAVAALSEIDGRHPDESPAHDDAALMILRCYCA